MSMPASPADFREQLMSNAWFGSLPAPLQSWLVSAGELVWLQAGESLFHRGDHSSDLYAVLEGALNIGAVDEAGREALLTVAEPVTWFGEITLFDGLPRTHDAIAAGPTTLLRVPQKALERLLQEQPRYWRDFALLMAQKLRLSFLNVEALSLLPAAPRLARRLLMIAQGYEGTARIQTHIQLSQERLAMMLSMSRQTTNQLLRELEQQGIVRLRFGGIDIVDLAGLQRAAGLPEGE